MSSLVLLWEWQNALQSKIMILYWICYLIYGKLNWLHWDSKWGRKQRQRGRLHCKINSFLFWNCIINTSASAQNMWGENIFIEISYNTSLVSMQPGLHPNP